MPSLSVAGDVLGGAAVGLPVLPEAVGAVGAAVHRVAPRAVELGALAQLVAVEAVLGKGVDYGGYEYYIAMANPR